MSVLVSRERIEQTILIIRGHRVMLDADLAGLYGVTTKRLNEQVKRNRKRFPADFMFQLTSREKAEVVANCDHLTRLKFSPAKPFAFTEHGAVMVASVLNSERAVEVSVYVVRAFVKLRELLGTHKKLAQKLAQLERRVNLTMTISILSSKPSASSWNHPHRDPAASVSKPENRKNEQMPGPISRRVVGICFIWFLIVYLVR